MIDDAAWRFYEIAHFAMALVAWISAIHAYMIIDVGMSFDIANYIRTSSSPVKPESAALYLFGFPFVFFTLPYIIAFARWTFGYPLHNTLERQWHFPAGLLAFSIILFIHLYRIGEVAHVSTQVMACRAEYKPLPSPDPCVVPEARTGTRK